MVLKGELELRRETRTIGNGMSIVIQIVKTVSEIHYLSCSVVLSGGFSCFATNSFEPALESSAVNKRVFFFIC